MSRSIILAGGIPAKLQFVSMLLRRIRLDELASVMISSLSRSRSLSLRRCPYALGAIDTCVLGAIDVSAVEATIELLSWLISPLKTDGDAVVDPLDTISFKGAVLTISEWADIDSLSLLSSPLLCDTRLFCTSMTRVGFEEEVRLLDRLLEASGLFWP